MKVPFRILFPALAVFVTPLAQALDYTWDTSADGGIQGGPGTWQNGGGPTNWTADGGTTRVVWTNNTSNAVIFSGSAGGQITVANTIQNGGISLLTTGYSFVASVARNVTTGGDITLGAGTSTTIGSNVTFTRVNNQIVTGAGSLTIGSGGTLTSSSNNAVAIRGTVGNTATVIVDGGTLSAGSTISLATSSSGGNGVLTIQSGTASAVGNVILGDASGKTATLNLNGGILSAAQVVRTGGTGNFNFNGGTLRANSNSATFMAGLSSANVLEGGAVIDSNGSDVTVGQALVHGGVSAIDGGLTKSGAGILTLTGASTYTGQTSVEGGTLSIDNNNTTSARLAATNGVTISSGTLLLSQSGATSSTDRISNSAAVILDGGTFNLNGLSEGAAGTNGVGLLSVTASSTIDFGSSLGANLVQFSGLDLHTASTTLSILNWESGLDRLLFSGTDTSVFTSLFSQGDVNFNGVSGYQIISGGSYFEVAAVPEPGTILLGSLGLTVLLLARRRSHRQG